MLVYLAMDIIYIWAVVTCSVLSFDGIILKDNLVLAMVYIGAVAKKASEKLTSLELETVLFVREVCFI